MHFLLKIQNSNMPLSKICNFQTAICIFKILRGADQDRTDDLFVANEALSQLSYSPDSSYSYLESTY